jgi:hypothetical protein
MTRCAWCGDDVEEDDGFRAYEVEGRRVAAFCRLEHVVAWGLRSAYWDPATEGEGADSDAQVSECAQCGAPLGDVHVVLVRRRGEARIPDGFCSVDHMLAWAKRGGRWAPPA